MELKDALSYTDITEAEILVDGKPSLEKFKEVFNAKFLPRNQLKDVVKADTQLVNELTGSRVGAIDAAFNRLVKKSGIEFDEETSKAGLEKKIDFAFTTLSKTKDETIKSLKAELELKDVDAIVNEHKKKYEKLNSTYTDTKGLLEKTASELEQEKKRFIDFEKSFTIKSAHEGALSKIKFSQEVQKNPVLKEGFLSIVSKKYKLDTDETGKVVPFTLEGKRIPHPSKADKFMDVEELYEHEAVNNNLIAKEQASKFGNKLAVVGNPKENQQNGDKPLRQTWKDLGGK